MFSCHMKQRKTSCISMTDGLGTEPAVLFWGARMQQRA